jgi:hypothetical protein
MNSQPTQLHSTKTYKGKTLALTLLPDESVLLAWETQPRAEELIVTTHRVQVSQSGTGRRSKTNIMLESITACTLEFRSHVVLIILAVLLLAAGLVFVAAGEQQGVGFALAGLGVLFAILYARSRGQVVQFITAGAKIEVRCFGRSLNDVRRFVETVEAAKNARYIQNSSRGNAGHPV